MFSLIIITLLSLILIWIWHKEKQLRKTLDNWIQEKEKTTAIFNNIFNNIQAYVLIIDPNFFVLNTNYYTVNDISTPERQKRVGEMFHCQNTETGKACGKGPLCPDCPIRKTIQQAFKNKTNFKNLETTLHIHLKDKAPICCNVLISGVYFNGYKNNPLLLLTVYDISELKKKQINLEKEKEEAQKNEKRKLAFLSNLGHEIRTPLNSIIGLTELIVEERELDPEERENYMEIINRNSNALQNIINDMLTLSRIESDRIELNLSQFYIRNFCYNMLAYRQNDSKSNVSFYLDNTLPELLIESDQTKLLQVFFNLISNAQKFTTEGYIRLNYHIEKDGTFIHFLLEDTGKGIAPENLTTIFERFNKASSLSQGTGLGLPISKAYIEALGGEISIESEIDKGTKVHFSIRNLLSHNKNITNPLPS